MDPEPRQEAVVVPDVYQGLHAKYSGMLRGMFEYHQSVFLRNVNTFPTNFSLCNMGQGMVEGRFRVTDVYLQNPACEIIVTASNLSLDIYTNKSPETVANISQEFEGHFRKFSKNPNILLTVREGMGDFRVKIFNPKPSDHDWMSGILDSAFLAFAVAVWNKYEVLRRSFYDIALLPSRKRNREQRAQSPVVILDLVNNGAAAQEPVVPMSGEGMEQEKSGDNVTGYITESDDDYQLQYQRQGPADSPGEQEGMYVKKRKQSRKTIEQQYEDCYRCFSTVDKAVEEYWKRHEEIEALNLQRPDLLRKRHMANCRGLILHLENLFEQSRTSELYSSLPRKSDHGMRLLNMSLIGASTVKDLITILFPEDRNYRLGGEHSEDWITQLAPALYNTAGSEYRAWTKQGVVEILRNEVRLNLEGLIPIAKSMENTEGLEADVSTSGSDYCLCVKFEGKQYTISIKIPDHKSFHLVVSPSLELGAMNLILKNIVPRMEKDLKKEIPDIGMTISKSSSSTELEVEKQRDGFLTTKEVSSMLVTVFAIVFKNEHILNGPSIFELGDSVRDFAVSGPSAP